MVRGGLGINTGETYVISETVISRNRGGMHMGKRKPCFIKHGMSLYYYFFVGQIKIFISFVIKGIT